MGDATELRPARPPAQQRRAAARQEREPERWQTPAGKRQRAADATRPRLTWGAGAQLPAEIRTREEQRLGVDLSDVRVHTGAQAQRAAASLGARAFTQGRDLGFAAGAYRPERADGQGLIAHELRHVAAIRRGEAPAGRVYLQADVQADEPYGHAEMLQEDWLAATERWLELTDLESIEPALYEEVPAWNYPEVLEEYLEDPKKRARAWRAFLLVSRREPTSFVDLGQLEDEAARASQREEDTLSLLGQVYLDLYPRAFPETWAARVREVLLPPGQLDQWSRDAASWWNELVAKGAEVPPYVYRHGLPVSLAEALALSSFQLRPGHAHLPYDHAIRDFAALGLQYRTAALRGEWALGWRANAERLAQAVEGAERTVVPESYARARFVPIATYTPEQLLEKARDLPWAEAARDPVDLERFAAISLEAAAFRAAALWPKLWNRVVFAFLPRHEDADQRIAGATRDQRLDLAYDWASARGYYMEAAKLIGDALADAAPEMAAKGIFSAILYAIPGVNLVFAGYELVQAGYDVYEGWKEIDKVRDRVRSAQTAVALQRATAELVLAYETRGLQIALSLAHIRGVAKRAKARAGKVRGKTPRGAARVAAPTVDPKQRRFADWFGHLDLASQKKILLDRGLAERLRKAPPFVRTLITRCASPCRIPDKATQAQIARIEAFFQRHGGADKLDDATRRAYEVFFHDQTKANRLDDAVKAIEGLRRARDIRAKVTDVEITLRDWPGLRQAGTGARQKAEELLQRGYSIEQLGKIMDSAKSLQKRWGYATGGERMLEHVTKLDDLKRAGVKGVDKVLADLAHPDPNFHFGAEWVIRYLSRKDPSGKDKWGEVSKFETRYLDAPGARRYDVQLGDKWIQFKSWSRFDTPRGRETFLKQIVQDFDHPAWKKGNLEWRFEPRIGDKAKLLESARQVLDDAVKAKQLDREIAREIKQDLDIVFKIGWED